VTAPEERLSRALTRAKWISKGRRPGKRAATVGINDDETMTVLAKAVRAVLELHSRNELIPALDGRGAICDHDGTTWPCQTMRAMGITE
jgi:hypothetical protein